MAKKQRVEIEKVIDVTEDFTPPELIQQQNEEIEVIHCQWCGKSNVISKVPYDRRRRKARHIILDDATFNALRMFCIPYVNVNHGVNILLHRAMNRGSGNEQ